LPLTAEEPHLRKHYCIPEVQPYLQYTPILSLAIVFSQRINPNSTSHSFAAFDMSTSSLPSSFQVYFASALRDYEKLTGATLINHPLSAQLLTCDSPGSLANLLTHQVQAVSASLAGGESISQVRHGRKALMGVLRYECLFYLHLRVHYVLASANRSLYVPFFHFYIACPYDIQMY